VGGQGTEEKKEIRKAPPVNLLEVGGKKRAIRLQKAQLNGVLERSKAKGRGPQGSHMERGVEPEENIYTPSSHRKKLGGIRRNKASRGRGSSGGG